MSMQISGHGIEVTAALSDLINKKFSRVKKHFDQITSAHIILDVHKTEQMAEATIHIPGHEIYAKADSDDMYKTIDLLMDKIIRQLDKYKAKHHSH